MSRSSESTFSIIAIFEQRGKRGVVRALAVAGGFTLFFGLFFWPVIGHGLIFGDPVDQVIEALPMYLGSHPFWQPLSMLGFPYSANPLSVTWYPLAALRLVHGSFDVYELSAYVIAACGAFGLAWSVARTAVGATVAGLVYSLSGFMIGHAGHIGLIHPAAWVPWVFWSLTALRENGSARNVAFTAAAFAMLALAGQPDIAIYTLYAAAAYCVVVRSWRYSIRFGSALVLAGALAAIVLLPGLELALASPRVNLSLEEHLGFALPLAALPFRLFFPYLLGQTAMAPYTLSGNNIGSFAEMSNYVGVTTLVLALIGATARSGVRIGFWVGLFVVALVLSTGNDLGAGTLTYHLPGLSWFRAPGRYAFEVALAASVLAAAGIAAIERAAAPRLIAACIASVAAAMAILLTVLVLDGRVLVATVARDYGLYFVPARTVDPARNAALWVPALVLAVGVVAIVTFAYRPRAAVSRSLLVAVIALDLASFGWFGYWHYAAFRPTRVDPPPYAAALRAAIAPNAQRVFSLPTEDVTAGIAPNLNLLWNIASVRGYTNLALARPAAMLRVDTLRTLRAVLADDDRTLDAAGVRYAIVPGSVAVTRPIAHPFDKGSALGLRIGAGEQDAALAAHIDLPPGRPATAVAVLSYLVGGAGILPGTVVIALRLTDARGRSESVAVRSGSGPARVDVLALPAPIVARRIDLRWLPRAVPNAALDVERLALVNARTRSTTPITALTFLASAPQRWRLVGVVSGDRIFENRRAFPRAWIVHRAQSLPDDDVLAAIVGQRWDPARVVLVSGNAPALEAPVAGAGSEAVRIATLEPSEMVLDVTCSTRCAVVTSDAPYPGWSARVDANPVPMFVADYAFRGVVVPAGKHRVAFAFRPWSTIVGAAITFGALVLTLWLAGPRNRQLERRPAEC